LIAESQL